MLFPSGLGICKPGPSPWMVWATLNQTGINHSVGKSSVFLAAFSILNSQSSVLRKEVAGAEVEDSSRLGGYAQGSLLEAVTSELETR